MAWEIVVGIETHAQLATRSKMFSGAATAFGAPPNTQACAVDIALPGVLPVANAAAVDCAIRFGLAVGGERRPGWNINRRSVFARKNYFYPDLPKGYQISQYELPIVTGGEVRIVLAGGVEKTVRLTRAHLEEDAGKSLHEDFHGMTGIDLNRAGTPLLEIVSEPELRGAQEAVAYARTLHALVRWIGICDGNMQEGSFRCDANVSVRKQGDEKLGTRCEIKNLNSFLFMEQAIAFEARRQIEILEDGGRIAQETRLYDPDKGETRSMRSKEDAQDYRYFPDPDLLPLVVSDALLARARASLPELPEARRARLVSLYALTPAQASLLTTSIETSSYALAALEKTPAARRQDIANWISGPLSAKLNESGLDIAASRVTPEQLRRLAEKVEDGTLSGKMVKEVIEAVWSGDQGVDEVIAKRGLQQVSDAGAIEKVVDDVLAKNARQVEDYRAGKEKAFNALVGQVMKATQGKANPAQVNAILKAKLGRP
ncbi:MAG TPA: Asp-tRNA(Asn)/Glu-tRNA(Gln) amidotransferase subunit GatB [Burkholderiales bacterium]|nr:Asp-tRNA(Asn)/Glu-tRNA(Gln) amidotransferase subunit GatB [Burkholderiales bacterium]